MACRVLMLGAVNSPHIEHLATGMSQRGLDVTVAGYVSGTLPPASYPASIDVRVMPALTLSRLGLPFHVRWIRGLLRDAQPDVTQAHGLAMFGLSAALAGADPLVGVAWGSDVLTTSRRLLLQDRLAIRHSTLVMADTPMLVNRVIQLGAQPDDAKLVGWGVDLETFKPPCDKAAAKHQLGMKPGPVVLSPRGLAPIYNQEIVLEAFETIRRALPDAQLVVKHPESATPARLERAGPGVSVVSSVPYSELASYYQAADVCVSIPSSDSGPRSVWEAMACGTPCVLSDLPWISGSVRPESEALVVVPTPDAVASAVMRLLTNPALAHELSYNARERVATDHDQSKAMDHMCATLVSVARRSR